MVADIVEEAALVARFAERRWDNKLDGSLAQWLVDALEAADGMKDVGNFDTAWEHLSTTKLALEDWDDGAEDFKFELLIRLHALRPSELAGAWCRTVSCQRLQDGASSGPLDEAGLRAFLEPDGTYELRLSDAKMFVMLGPSFGSLFRDAKGAYSEAVSPDPPDTEDIELPDVGGQGTQPMPGDVCIPRAMLTDIVVKMAAQNVSNAAALEWIDLP